MNITRRRFLRATGISMALPVLEYFQPRGLAAVGRRPIRRMVCVCTPLGLHAPYFFPEQAGKDYTLSPYLELLKEHRDDFSVISGLAHPEVGASHDSIYSFLTGAPHPEIRGGFKNSISLDQFAAEQIGGETRFPSMSLASEGFGLSWTRGGALVPAPAASPAYHAYQRSASYSGSNTAKPT